jgi:acetamidase/formamidase
MLCSVAADLHVTQLVDGNKGAHVMLSKAIFTNSHGVAKTKQSAVPKPPAQP